MDLGVRKFPQLHLLLHLLHWFLLWLFLFYSISFFLLLSFFFPPSPSFLDLMHTCNRNELTNLILFYPFVCHLLSSLLFLFLRLFSFRISFWSSLNLFDVWFVTFRSFSLTCHCITLWFHPHSASFILIFFCHFTESLMLIHTYTHTYIYIHAQRNIYIYIYTFEFAFFHSFFM